MIYDQFQRETDNAQREVTRRIMVDALTNQAERYDSKARTIREKARVTGDMGARSFLAGQATEVQHMAETARRIRDQIKEA